MEFLVHLEDKVNVMVFCLNPVHKGLKDDRFFYVDPTFAEPCPDCKSDKFLFRKNNAINKKGHFITYKTDGWTWGENERKHFGIVRINCTDAEAKEWCTGKGRIVHTDKTSIVNYRPRKYALDYEAVLTAQELMAWKDMEMDSTIKVLAPSDLTNIKAIP